MQRGVLGGILGQAKAFRKDEGNLSQVRAQLVMRHWWYWLIRCDKCTLPRYDANHRGSWVGFYENSLNCLPDCFVNLKGFQRIQSIKRKTNKKSL